MIQERLIQFIDYKGISKYKFYKKTGLSNGFLDKKGSIGVDKCEIIYSFYPELNFEWLVLGKGDMLNTNSIESMKQNITGDSNIMSGNDTNIGDGNNIKKLEKELQECKRLLTEKDKTISQLVNLMSSK